MQTITRIFFLLSLISAFFACRNEPPSNNKAESVSKAKDLFVVTVSDLRLRAAPNGQAEVLGQLAEGTVVEGLGETSDKKEEIELRGRLWLEPYHRVMAPGNKQGWLYGGGLLRVYSGDGKPMPVTEKVEAYAMQLAKLDPKKVASGKTAFELAQAGFAGADATTSDAGCLILEHFLRRMLFEGDLYNITDDPKWMDEALMGAVYENRFDMNTFPETRELAESGFLLTTAEGSVFPETDYKRLLKAFEGKLSAPVKACFEQSAKEMEVPAWADGGIVLPLTEIVDRAAWWEKFNKENPHFVQREATRFNESYLILSVTHGGDNTPVTDYEKNEIIPEFREAWRYAQQTYPGTRTADYCRRMQAVCEKSGWKSTPEVEAEMKKISEELLPE